MTETNKRPKRTCRCGHGAVDHDRWGKGACTPWLRDAHGIVYVGKCGCKEAEFVGAAGERQEP